MFRDETAIHEFRGPFGVPVQIGASVMLLLLLFVSFHGTPRDIFFDLVFVAMLLGSMLAHELGHAWGARVQGLGVRRIRIHAGGGFCDRAGRATRTQSELIVAMGPIVNLVLWAVSSLALNAVPHGTLYLAIDTLAWINLYLALFNLLPVQPLDGGKLLELLLLRLVAPGPAMRICGVLGLVLMAVWLPMMLASYAVFGMVLVFVPSLRLNLDMARGIA